MGKANAKKSPFCFDRIADFVMCVGKLFDWQQRLPCRAGRLCFICCCSYDFVCHGTNSVLKVLSSLSLNFNWMTTFFFKFEHIYSCVQNRPIELTNSFKSAIKSKANFIFRIVTCLSAASHTKFNKLYIRQFELSSLFTSKHRRKKIGRETGILMHQLETKWKITSKKYKTTTTTTDKNRNRNT